MSELEDEPRFVSAEHLANMRALGDAMIRRNHNEIVTEPIRRHISADMKPGEGVMEYSCRIQDEVLGQQHDWLSSLPEDLRRTVFEHMCAVTGQLLDRLGIRG